MARSRKPYNRLIKCILAFSYGRRITAMINGLAIRVLGLRVVSARYALMDKRWFDRLLYFQRLFDLVENIDGDVVECGVASGYSLAMLVSLVRSSGKNRHIWGFDTWSGLPAPRKEDLVSPEAVSQQGLFGENNKKTVLATCRTCGFEDSEISNLVTLVKGLFSETLSNYQGSHIALLHIDADLYQSYKDTLQTLWPKVSVGGIVAFDEYQPQGGKFPGARQAVDEFLAKLAPGSARLEKDRLFKRYYAVKCFEDAVNFAKKTES